MFKKVIIISAIIASMAIVPCKALASTSVTNSNWPNEMYYKPIQGETRYETAVAIANKVQSNHASAIVLATGNSFADALSASVLAHQKNAPILLVDSTVSGSSDAFGYIKAHCDSSTAVYIVGGAGVISNDFVSELNSMGISNVTRLGGVDRYDTDGQIAIAENVQHGTPVAVCYGQNYPDALSIASYAAHDGYPILLTNTNDLSSETKSFIENDQPSKVYVIGGTGVISQDVQNQIQSLSPSSTITRFGGADRYATNMQVVSHFSQTPSTIYFATGENYPDALAGSALSSKNGDPLVLLSTSSYEQTEETSDYCANNRQATIVGLGAQMDMKRIGLARTFTSEVRSNLNQPVTKLELCTMIVNYMLSQNINYGDIVSIDPVTFKGVLDADTLLSAIQHPSFSDTDSKAAQLAYIFGIVNMEDGKFYPNSQLNREEAASIFANTIQADTCGNMTYVDQKTGAYSMVGEIHDLLSADNQYIDAIESCVNDGVMPLDSNGNFNPMGEFTEQDAINIMCIMQGGWTYRLYSTLPLRGKVIEFADILSFPISVSDNSVTISIPQDNTPDSEQDIHDFQSWTESSIIPTGQQLLLWCCLYENDAESIDKIPLLSSKSTFDVGYMTIENNPGTVDTLEFLFKSGIKGYVGGQNWYGGAYGEYCTGSSLKQIS
jgi:putative cell wall-binding protein